MEMITDWSRLAACRDGDPDALFVQGAEQNIAKRICRGCPVRYECLADALDNRIEFGVWGGSPNVNAARCSAGTRTW